MSTPSGFRNTENLDKNMQIANCVSQNDMMQKDQVINTVDKKQLVKHSENYINKL